MKQIWRSLLYPTIPGSWLTLLLGVIGLSAGPVQAERILDLTFWSSDQTELALGGLWEFHVHTLLEPMQRHVSSEVLLDISNSWRRFRPAPNQLSDPVQQASYVMLIKGLVPSAAGYWVSLPAADAGTTLIVAPKYVPEEKEVARAPIFANLIPSFLRPALRITFAPRSVDEIWLLIVQRQTSPDDERRAIPRLSVAAGSHAFHPGNSRSK